MDTEILKIIKKECAKHRDCWDEENGRPYCPYCSLVEEDCVITGNPSEWDMRSVKAVIERATGKKVAKPRKPKSTPPDGINAMDALS